MKNKTMKFSFALFAVLLLPLALADVCKDDTGPNAPTGVQATASNGHIVISWNAVTDDQPCDGIDHYNVYRSTAATGTFAKIGQSSTTSFEDSSISLGVTYFYKVSAVDRLSYPGPRESALAGTPSNIINSVCGDASCSSGETCSSCQADCGTCGGGGGGGGGFTPTLNNPGDINGGPQQWACTRWSACIDGKETRKCELSAVTKTESRNCGEETVQTFFAEEPVEAAGDQSNNEVVKDILMPDLEAQGSGNEITGAALGPLGFASYIWLLIALLIVGGLFILFFAYRRRR